MRSERQDRPAASAFQVWFVRRWRLVKNPWATCAAQRPPQTPRSPAPRSCARHQSRACCRATTARRIFFIPKAQFGGSSREWTSTSSWRTLSWRSRNTAFHRASRRALRRSRCQRRPCANELPPSWLRASWPETSAPCGPSRATFGTSSWLPLSCSLVLFGLSCAIACTVAIDESTKRRVECHVDRGTRLTSRQVERRRIELLEDERRTSTRREVQHQRLAPDVQQRAERSAQVLSRESPPEQQRNEGPVEAHARRTRERLPREPCRRPRGTSHQRRDAAAHDCREQRLCQESRGTQRPAPPVAPRAFFTAATSQARMMGAVRVRFNAAGFVVKRRPSKAK